MVGWSITFRLLSHFGTDPLSQISSQSQFHNCIRFCHSSEWVRTSCESAGSAGRHLRTKQSNWPTSVHLHFATILHPDLVPGCSKYPSFSTPGLPLQCIGSNCQTGDQKSKSLLRGLKKGVKTYQQPTGRFVWNGSQKTTAIPGWGFYGLKQCISGSVPWVPIFMKRFLKQAGEKGLECCRLLRSPHLNYSPTVECIWELSKYSLLKSGWRIHFKLDNFFQTNSLTGSVSAWINNVEFLSNELVGNRSCRMVKGRRV